MEITDIDPVVYSSLQMISLIKILYSSQINHGIYLQDSQKEFSVMVDRAIGGSSIVDGQVELMLHRY